MEKTAVTSTPETAAVSPTPTPPPPPAPDVDVRRRPEPHPLVQALKLLASLKLTVVLFVLSIFLVFFGTLAQMENGVWTVVNQYFRSAYVWVPFDLLVKFGKVFFFFPKTWYLPGSFPFPGGWLLGTLLLINLLAAHAVRFKVTWKRSGILILHAGLVIMMLGELVTGLFATEAHMRIDQGQSANYAEENRFVELAITRPQSADVDEVVVVPQSLLKQGGSISDKDLPFDIKVVKYMVNSELVRAEGQPEHLATAGAGLTSVAVERGEVSGTAAQQTVDAPSAYVVFKDKNTGEEIGTYLVSLWLKPQPVKVGDTTYDVGLRFKRTYYPYSLHLVEFKFDRYEGTDMAKNFSSLVRIDDPETGVRGREAMIRMNEPLRYRGSTFFQADWDKDTEKATILQVVSNPGWMMPYISCTLVALGMMMHFGLNLVEFLKKRMVA